MFPSFLEPVFAEEMLDGSASSVAAIDRHGTILWVNRTWRDHATEHGANAATVGASYFGGISAPLRSHFEQAFADALAAGTVYELEYECSSPVERLHFQLRALPMDGRGLLLEHSLLVALAHDEPHEAIATRYLREDGTISQCSNCRRVHHPATAAWHWVPSWVRHPHTRTSHGICPSCMGFYWGRRAKRRAKR